jgi:hypothetical protein
VVSLRLPLTRPDSLIVFALFSANLKLPEIFSLTPFLLAYTTANGGRVRGMGL